MLTQLLLAGATSLWAFGAGNPVAKDFTLTDSSGRKVSLHDFYGKVVLLNFWATWCTPCRDELPALERMQKRFAKRGFVVVAVSVDNEAENIHQFVRKFDLKLLTLWDKDKRVAGSYDVKRMPSSYLIDRRGKIRAVHYGYSPEGLKRMKSEAEDLLDEKVPAGRQRRSDSASAVVRQARP